MVVERLQKYLASAGIASRRQCEELIRQGLVTVNGKVVTELGTKIDTRVDKIIYNKNYVNPVKAKLYYKMNKPKDYITTTSDPKNRKTVLDLLAPDMKDKLFPVGRLDRNTTGLLLFTNDGALANRLLHPSKKIAKVYRVLVNGPLTKKQIASLETGVLLDDGPTSPALVELESYEDGRCQFLLTIYEGRNRQVRRMCEAIGHEVLALKRISFGGLTLGNLASGKVKPLNSAELRLLKDLARTRSSQSR